MYLKHNPKNGHHFLVLMQGSSDGPIRGIVVRTVLRQFGQFMMGHAIVQAGGKRHKLPLSGCYGSDGLTILAPLEVYAKGVDVPADLIKAWSGGEGWNDAGREGPAMKAWGLSLLEAEKAKERKPRAAPKGRMNADAAARFYRERLMDLARWHERRLHAEEWTHDEMLAHWRGTVTGCEGWNRVPAWVHERLMGWREHMLCALDERQEWRVWISGEGHIPCDVMKGRSYEGVDPEKGARVWRDTGKVFSGYDPAKVEA